MLKATSLISLGFILTGASAFAAPLCSEMSDIDHETIGFECQTEGAQKFTRVNYRDYGVSGWQDPDGVVWSGVMGQADQASVEKICTQAGGFAPDAAAFTKLINNFSRSSTTGSGPLALQDIDWKSYHRVFSYSFRHAFWMSDSGLLFADPKGSENSLNKPVSLDQGFRALFTSADPKSTHAIRCTSRAPLAKKRSDGPTLRFGPLSMAFSVIPAANHTFLMGSKGEAGNYSEEFQHPVLLTYNYEMQTMDVTQEQWMAVMGTNPSYFKTQDVCPETYRSENGGLCPTHPVEQVSWHDIYDFLKKLNALADTGCSYRLPTEAEWEYAARGGTTGPHYFGKNFKHADDYAWSCRNSNGKTHAVGQKLPNAFGLYDMAGNVWQWTSDWFGEYPRGLAIDPVGPASGSTHPFRGGGATAHLVNCRAHRRLTMRSAARLPAPSNAREEFLGFRLVRTCP